MPTLAQEYKIKKGDTLGSIAKGYSPPIESAFEGVIGSMSGKETPKQLVEKAAKKFAMGPSMDKALMEFQKKHGSKLKK